MMDYRTINAVRLGWALALLSIGLTLAFYFDDGARDVTFVFGTASGVVGMAAAYFCDRIEVSGPVGFFAVASTLFVTCAFVVWFLAALT